MLSYRPHSCASPYGKVLVQFSQEVGKLSVFFQTEIITLDFVPPTKNQDNKGGESGTETVNLVDLVKGGLSSRGCEGGRRNKGHSICGWMNRAAQILQPGFWLTCPPQWDCVSPDEARTGGSWWHSFQGLVRQ